MLLNEKRSLIPNDCHCGETNCTGSDPNILVSTRELCVIGANRSRNIITGLISIHIIDRY